MYIKSITINGFKSYAEKTIINNFDRSFNAITGLNGSGKSNILDSICFVFGITNVNLVRVNNLRELIYKNGQAGVTKASVTIEFDNTDTQQTPVGYENDKIITLRKEINVNNNSKYFINGDKKSSSQIIDFFHSVQLNINNPHFLIMQGKITKVINMKPKEVLGMIEEATNISMYENKKKESYHQIEKKEIDIKNINSLINESIIPKYEQLKKEQVKLVEFQKINAELEHSIKVYTAWNYLESLNLCEKTETLTVEKYEQINKIKKLNEEISVNIIKIDKKIKDLEKEKDKEFGDNLQKLDKELKKVQSIESKEKTNFNLKKDYLKEEKKRKKEIEKIRTDDNKLLFLKQTDYENFKNSYNNLKEMYEKNQQELEEAEKKFQAISMGLSCENGKVSGSFQDQLIQAQKEVNNFETETITLKNELNVILNELKKSIFDLNVLNSNSNGTFKIEEMQNEVDELNLNLNKINFDKKKLSCLLEEKENLKHSLNICLDKIRRIQMETPMLTFNYNKPEENFDDKRVLGVVASLFKVKDKKYLNAIEKIAGSKLFNIVVDSDYTAKLILEKCELDRKRTFLPLNVLKGRSVDEIALKNAEKLVGKENVCSAVNLIEYDKKINEVIKYVFADTLICSDLESAKKVTFAKNVLKRSVTLDGDVFDPSGTLSGGSNNVSSVILTNAYEIKNFFNQMKDLQNQLDLLENEIKSITDLSKKYFDLKKILDEKIHNLDMIKIKFTRHINLTNEIKSLEIKVEEIKNNLKNASKNKILQENKIIDLELKIKDSKFSKERELKEMKTNLEKAKKNVKNTKNFEEQQKKIDSLNLEIEEIKNSIEVNTNQIDEIDKIIEEIKSQILEIEKKVNIAKSEVLEVMDKIKEQKNLLQIHCSEINKLQREKNTLIKKIDDDKLKEKDLEHQINQIKIKSVDSKKTVENLLKKHTWINEEKHLFGNKDLGYGFENFNSDEFLSKIQKLETIKTKIEKTVNLKVQLALKDKESELEELKKKKKIVEDDKHKLLKYIEEVDKEKLKTLEQAYEKVNKDFGSIFSTLLPGTQARLERFDEKSIYEGLKIKIAFGGIWKESLTELSGGQRSLIALSLVFSLLLYKPAPIYILDEVDAALDQNHTQNIGIMIKKHFARSQFIIVSLKDDMFNNANVLFKTKFLNGTSTVSRFSKI